MGVGLGVELPDSVDIREGPLAELAARAGLGFVARAGPVFNEDWGFLHVVLAGLARVLELAAGAADVSPEEDVFILGGEGVLVCAHRLLDLYLVPHSLGARVYLVDGIALHGELVCFVGDRGVHDNITVHVLVPAAGADLRGWRAQGLRLDDLDGPPVGLVARVFVLRAEPARHPQLPPARRVLHVVREGADRDASDPGPRPHGVDVDEPVLDPVVITHENVVLAVVDRIHRPAVVLHRPRGAPRVQDRVAGRVLIVPDQQLRPVGREDVDAVLGEHPHGVRRATGGGALVELGLPV
mmetsp:Transcript_19021/g.45659  ORF Transcript_19021/g.45659 Transcript_19021/m.45659 type:complete len:297 (-) Transcript_19021:538-1428(-)